MYSRGNYNFLRVVNARECARASDPFTVASTFEGTRVFSREECILACERLACVARASREVCYLSRERYCTYMCAPAEQTTCVCQFSVMNVQSYIYTM